MKKWCIGVLIIVLVALCGSFVYAQKSVLETDNQQGSSTTSSSLSVNDENKKKADLVRDELAKIITPYENISSEFQIECRVQEDAICNVDIVLKCKNDLSIEEEASIKKQLSESVDVPADNISITYGLLLEE